MGSCISKCRPKKKPKLEECHHVQDKLVISQAPIVSPIPPLTRKPLTSSPSPTASNSSFSSFSCATVPSSLSTSSSSCLSSTSSSKDKSFTNEFLWSCVKENPQVIGHGAVKSGLQKSVQYRVSARKLESSAEPIVAPVKQSTPRKRARATSSSLTRQKSFRKEPEGPNSTTYSLPSRTMRSPSPSRRFDGNTPGESCCKRNTDSNLNAVHSGSFSTRKENMRPLSPYNNLSGYRSYMRRGEGYAHQIGSIMDEIAVGEVKSDEKIDCIPMEDVDNPLIALDCFIFL
ncbi:hypothetical protein RJ640_029927 [Escallonia rubra]|uniref:Uncharacterized protein n=1 Tax=Escallonia rubra TaxID=112253 RepID=A0AA88UQN1_9ASTE|nr:hypothetical protein RJ640_029927 [Escallonia rubra]